MFPSAQVINWAESKEKHRVVSLCLSSTLTARQTAFLLPSLAPASSVSPHPCASHTTDPNTVLPQGALGHSSAERGVVLVQMNLPPPALVSSTREGEGRKRREGEKQKPGREEWNFFLNGSLLDCGCAAVPPAWVSQGEKGCGPSADGFLTTFLCLTVIIGANPTSSKALAMRSE